MQRSGLSCLMNDMMEHGATRVRIYLGKAHDMLLGFIPLVLLAKNYNYTRDRVCSSSVTSKTFSRPSPSHRAIQTGRANVKCIV